MNHRNPARKNYPLSGELDQTLHEDHPLVDHVATLVNKLTGVQFGIKQKSMVLSRLKRRISELGLSSVSEYQNHLNRPEEGETEALVSLLTTHHTYFFREHTHFDLLENQMLSGVVERVRARGERIVRVWSAACSRGQEVYSLAMCLTKWFALHASDLSFEILGTDVDPDSVRIAKNGVYHYREIKEVPLAYLGNHWVRGKGEISDFVKAKPSLRDRCLFGVENILEPSEQIKRKKFDLIFCRNVFIYFTQDQVRSVTLKFRDRLHPGGQLYIGISESLHGLGLDVQYRGPSVYSFEKEAGSGAEAPKTIPKPTAGPLPSKARLSLVPENASDVARALRVVCVDDSKPVLLLLKKILSPEQGYEVVGTASNGQEATQVIAELKPDLVTLDIHMPIQDGISYLKSNMRSGHPPVVMVTSVSREDLSLASEAMKLGASDYVEKPSMANLADKGEELRNKLKVAFKFGQKARPDQTVHSDFASTQTVGRSALRVILISQRDIKKLAFVELSQDPSPVVVLWDELDGRAMPSEILVNGKTLRLQAALEGSFEEHQIYQGSLAASVLKVKAWILNHRVSVFVVGSPSSAWVDAISHWNGAQILIEDGLPPGTLKDRLSKYAHDSVPITSFGYLARKYAAFKGGDS